MKIKNFEDFVAPEKGSLLIFFDGFRKMILIFDKISSLTGKDFFDLRVFVLKDSLFFRNNGKYKTYSFYKSNLKNLEIFLK